MTRIGKIWIWSKKMLNELTSPSVFFPVLACFACLLYTDVYVSNPEYGKAATKVVTCMIAFVVFLISLKNILLTNEKHKGEHGVRFTLLLTASVKAITQPVVIKKHPNAM